MHIGSPIRMMYAMKEAEPRVAILADSSRLSGVLKMIKHAPARVIDKKPTVRKLVDSLRQK